MSKVQFRSVCEGSDAPSMWIVYFDWIDKMTVWQQLELSEFLYIFMFEQES